MTRIYLPWDKPHGWVWDTRQGGLMQVIISRDVFIKLEGCVPISETYLFRDVSFATGVKTFRYSTMRVVTPLQGLGMRVLFTVGQAPRLGL